MERQRRLAGWKILVVLILALAISPVYAKRLFNHHVPGPAGTPVLQPLIPPVPAGPTLHTANLEIFGNWPDYSYNTLSTAVWTKTAGSAGGDATQSTEIEKPLPAEKSVHVLQGSRMWAPMTEAYTNAGADTTIIVRVNLTAINSRVLVTGGSVGGDGSGNCRMWYNDIGGQVAHYWGDGVHGLQTIPDFFVLNATHTYAITNKSTGGGNATGAFYIDGVPFAISGGSTSTVNGNAVNPQALFGYYGATTLGAEGYVASFGIWSTAMTADEVASQTLYMESLP
ncbi:MAG: hypothetical protein HQM09_15260 [Candidatus Riflebacteria bacterium]|nr:hypothetical protein [Candidatus Riflebacteria bacterium]